MAGNTAASNIEGFVYTSMNAFSQTVVSFTGQNFGAKKFDRVKKVVFAGCGAATVVGLTLGIFVYIFAAPLVGIFDSSPETLFYAKQRLALVALPYFLCGIMDVGSGFLRSIGYSFHALIITFVGSCVLRIAWVYTVFPIFNDVRALYVVFPISWFVTALTLLITFAICYKKEKKMMLNVLK
jgi:Na+-driven multidrug efflux pump